MRGRLQLGFPAAVVPALLWVAAGATAEPLPGSRQEEFLRTARIAATRPVGEGVTHSLRATLEADGFTHDAQIQTVDRRMPDLYPPDGKATPFFDSYRFNIAAYKLARLLGLGMVPVTVERLVDGKKAAVTWWVDGVQMQERTRARKGIRPPDRGAYNRQMAEAAVFDELIFNADRNPGNLLITQDWKLVLIDHTRAFVAKPVLGNPARLSRISRALLARLDALDAATVRKQLKPYLNDAEIGALVKRRGLLLKFFAGQVAKRNESEVLF